jgi:hypothetical protein
VVGTRSRSSIEHRRAHMAADWLVRVHTPAWLGLVGLTSQAQALELLPELTSSAQLRAIRELLVIIRDSAAGAARFARHASEGPPRAAFSIAQRASAGAAALSAFCAASLAPDGDIVCETAGDAGWRAGSIASEVKQANLKLKLQRSALLLFDRMRQCEQAP